MKATNTLAAPRPKQTFSTVINGDAMQGMIRKTLQSTQAAARFTSTLISAVASNEQLASCEASTIISSALAGEGKGLIYGSGYYLVPYGQKATFALGYKGMIQLCLSTGQYADINCFPVRFGEYRGRNPRTGRPEMDFSVNETDEQREAQPIIGYYAYFELKDGRFCAEYWDHNKILRHADRYSAAFSLEKYESLVGGTLNERDAERLKSGSPWYDLDGDGHRKMCAKTVLRQLLNSGYAPMSNEVRYMLQDEASREEESGALFQNRDAGGTVESEAVDVQDAKDAFFDGEA